jgi:hypothetical protein
MAKKMRGMKGQLRKWGAPVGAGIIAATLAGMVAPQFKDLAGFGGAFMTGGVTGLAAYAVVSGGIEGIAGTLGLGGGGF